MDSIYVKCLYVFLFLSLSFSKIQAQVDSVSYFVSYDSTNCWFDCSIVIEGGQAESIPQRTQFNSSYTLVVPTGVTIAMMQSYMPIQNNQIYTGTNPTPWNYGAKIVNPNGIGLDFQTFFPSINPSSQYNNIYTGDTIKVFSVSIGGLTDCGAAVRPFDNDNDPGSNDPGMEGGDFSNGFTMGGFNQLYLGNKDVISPSNPIFEDAIIDTEVGINIDVTGWTAACQGDLSYSWTGPNGYSSSSEDVVIVPAGPEDYGIFSMLASDDIGCETLMNVEVIKPASSNNEVIVGTLILNATYEHISAHLNIEGDDNLSSSFNLEYRLKGTTEYFEGATARRAAPDMIVDGSPLLLNFHAASAMFLQPNSIYDLRISLLDSDGGGTTIETEFSTKAFPTIPTGSNIVYVIPGNGGGSGTSNDPYKGIQEAVNNASPGDILEVSNGIYTPFTITTSGTVEMPIVIKSTNLHGAAIDGGDILTGIITIGSATDSIQHIMIDGFEIHSGKWGIDAQNTQYLTIRNNKIHDVDFGIYNRRENGWEHDQYITNNEIIGQTFWPQTDGSIPAERGIDIRGNRNVISYNSISDFGDGISMDGAPYKASYAVDIHNNDITRIVDDIIEIDGILSNARVYRNRGFNGRMGVSVAPVFGGPAYIFRNEFYNLETSTFKMNRSPSGLIIVNNTGVKNGRGLTSDSGWQNTIFKNNAIVSSHYCYEEFGLVSGSIDDWDGNGYKSDRAGTISEPWFKWDGIKYTDVANLKLVGLTELLSDPIDYQDFSNVTMPAAYSNEVLPNNVDTKPSVGSTLIDQGLILSNINQPFVFDGMPDIGAYEAGESVPEYGHDFATICDRIDLATRVWNGAISQAWFHPDNWIPCGVPNGSTEVTIPDGPSIFPYINSNVCIKDLIILEGALLELKGENVVLKVIGPQ